MSNRTERDFAENGPQTTRRRFMIAGEHVILRAFERDDAERCYRWLNDPNIVRTLKTRYPIAFQNEIEWLDRAMHPSDTERHFAIERTSAMPRSTTSTGSRAPAGSASSSGSRRHGTAGTAATRLARSFDLLS